MSNNSAKTRVYFILVVCVCVCLCLIHISRSRWWWKWSAPALLKPLCIDKLLPHQRTWNTQTHTHTHTHTHTNGLTHPQISQCTYSSTFSTNNTLSLTKYSRGTSSVCMSTEDHFRSVMNLLYTQWVMFSPPSFSSQTNVRFTIDLTSTFSKKSVGGKSLTLMSNPNK